MTNSEYTKTLKHIEQFEKNIPNILFQFRNNNPENSIQWFTLGMLQRLLYSSTAIKVLLPEYKKNSTIEFSIGIILRSILLDVLLAFKLYKLLKDGLSANLEIHQLFKELCFHSDSILTEGIIKTLIYFEDLKSQHLTDEAQLKKMYNKFTRDYPNLLIQPGGKGTKPQPRYKTEIKTDKTEKKSGKALFIDLSSDQEMKEITHRLYDLYIFYSKYDHFSLIGIEFSNYGKKTKSDRIIASISLFVNHYANLCDLLQRVTPNNLFIKEIQKSSQEYQLNKNK